MEQQLKYTALYYRLSKDDDREGESLSIETQRMLLRQYAQEKNLYPIREYLDDGFSGLNFNRPGIQKLLDDIALGEIQTVVVKDLSRFGRDHIKVGEYTEIYFPTHNVRFIALNDGVDTANQQSLDFSAIKNVMNEFYCRDTSRKIKASFKARAKQGKYRSTTPPFGYLKDPADKNHLIPNPETAHVVKKIYELCLKGWGNHRIRDYLRETKVPVPSWYNTQRGIVDRSYMFTEEGSQYIWRPDTLRLLIRNPVYRGACAMGRSEVIFKTKLHPKKDEADWIIVENTHEALVSPEDWERANQLIAVKRQQCKDNIKEPNSFFSGLLKCADCGKAMSRRNYDRGNAMKKQFVCGSYATYGSYKCTQHSVMEQDLISVVTRDINEKVALARANPAKFEELVIGKILAHSKKPTTSESVYKKLSKRIEELNKLIDKLYEDHVLERIDEETFDRLMAKYRSEQIDVKKRAESFEQAEKESKSAQLTATRCRELFFSVGELREEDIDGAVLNMLIDKILVHECDVEDDHKTQHIEIIYRFGCNETVSFLPNQPYKSKKLLEATRERNEKLRAQRIAAVQEKLDAVS